MIENQKQVLITQNAIDRFKAAIEKHRGVDAKDKALHRYIIDAMESQVKDLEAEIKDAVERGIVDKENVEIS